MIFCVLKPVTWCNFRVLTTLSLSNHSTRFDVAFQQRMRTFVFKKYVHHSFMLQFTSSIQNSGTELQRGSMCELLL